MAKFWKSKSFKEIEEEWEEILKDTGFIDAEKKLNGDRILVTSSLCLFMRNGKSDKGEITETYKENTLDYFQLLSIGFERENEFEDESDYLIMQKTIEGKKISQISRELKALEMRKHNRDTIRYIRRRYEDRWGIKTWDKNQMVSRRIKRVIK